MCEVCGGNVIECPVCGIESQEIECKECDGYGFLYYDKIKETQVSYDDYIKLKKENREKLKCHKC